MTLYADGHQFTKGIIQCPICERLGNYTVTADDENEEQFVAIGFTRVERYVDESHRGIEYVIVGLRCENGHEWVLEFNEHWSSLFFKERELHGVTKT